jgi:hypothetical protein
MDSTWIKASKSANGGECVEMRAIDQAVQVRDSKAGENAPILAMTRSSFGTWLEQAKRGELDELC